MQKKLTKLQPCEANQLIDYDVMEAGIPTYELSFLLISGFLSPYVKLVCVKKNTQF